MKKQTQKIGILIISLSMLVICLQVNCPTILDTQMKASVESGFDGFNGGMSGGGGAGGGY